MTKIEMTMTKIEMTMTEIETRSMGKYVSDPDKWYQHLLDIRDGLVELDYLGCYIVGSGEKHREMRDMKDQKPVVHLVSPVAQATAIAKSEIKRECTKEKRRKKAKIPPLRSK